MGKDKNQHRIVDLSGRNMTSQQDGIDGLEPGVIIVHCVLEPTSGRIQINRSERNPPPKTPEEFKVEVDNWFTLLTNCVALIIAKCIEMGLSRQLMLDTMNRVVNTYLDLGSTGGHRKKIVLSSGEEKTEKAAVIEKKSIEPAIQINYDQDFIAAGFKALGEETYMEYCGRVGLKDRDKERMPLASEFISAFVMRKKIGTVAGTDIFLEAARDKKLLPGPDDATSSKYVIAMVIDADSTLRKSYWQIKKPTATADLLCSIEAEALKMASALLL